MVVARRLDKLFDGRDQAARPPKLIVGPAPPI